jgi:hypothetical protein
MLLGENSSGFISLMQSIQDGKFLEKCFLLGENFLKTINNSLDGTQD